MNPLRDFFDECCVENTSAQATPMQLYHAYEVWNNGNSIKFPLRKREFWGRLEKAGFQRGQARIHGEPKRVFFGAGIKGPDSSENDLDNESTNTLDTTDNVYT